MPVMMLTAALNDMTSHAIWTELCMIIIIIGTCYKNSSFITHLSNRRFIQINLLSKLIIKSKSISVKNDFSAN